MKGNRKNIRILGTIGFISIISIIFIILFSGYFKKDSIVNDGKIVIGYCADGLVIERWQSDQEILVEKAKERGIEVIVYNANEDNDIQNEQILSLIEKKVDVIIVVPYEKGGLTQSIDAARKAGIKVIAYDRLITDTVVDAYISFDNVKVGELQAETLLEKVPSGNYVVINGSPEDNNSYMLNEGYMEALSPSVSLGKVKIVGEYWADDWREEPAYTAISDLLSEGIEIDAIISANDRLAEAAINILIEEGLAGGVAVAGQDADISACQRIVEGTQYVTIYKPIRKLAESAVDLAIQLAKGEEIEYTETINNGHVDVPYIKLDVVTVTADTMMETVVKDGFHREEDIYRY